MKKMFTLSLTIGMIGLLAFPSSGQAIFNNETPLPREGIDILKNNQFRSENSQRDRKSVV